MDKKKKSVRRKQADIYTGKDDLHLSPRGGRGGGNDLLLGCQIMKTETSPLIKNEFYSHQYYDNARNRTVGNDDEDGDGDGEDDDDDDDDDDEEEEEEENIPDTEGSSIILNTTTSSFDEEDYEEDEEQDGFEDLIPSVNRWKSRIRRSRSDESSDSGTSRRQRRQNKALVGGHIKGEGPSSCGRGWKRVKHHLRNGSFLLLPDSIHNKDYSRKKKKSQKSVRQDLMDKYDEGINFSIPSCLFAILIYLMVSIVIYHFILEPEWTAIDSCYFAVTTFTTLGYGDLTPSNRASMIFTCIYAFTGVAFLGVFLGVLGNRVIEKHNVMVGQVEDANRDQVMTMLGTSPSSLRCPYDQYFHDQSWLSNPIRIGSSSAQTTTERSIQWKLGDGLIKNKTPLFFVLVMVVVILTWIIAIREGWDGMTAIYYFLVTSCTIGYGDRVPVEQWERLISVIYIPLACLIMGNWLGFIAGTIMEHQSSQFRKSTMHRRELTQEDLDAMDANGNGKVSWAEFLEFTLVAMKKVDYELIEELQSYFREMDVTFTGELSRDDLVECARRKLKHARRKLALAKYKRKLINQGRFGHRRPAQPKHMLGKFMQTTKHFFSSRRRENDRQSELLPINRTPESSKQFRWST